MNQIELEKFKNSIDSTLFLNNKLFSIIANLTSNLNKNLNNINVDEIINISTSIEDQLINLTSLIDEKFKAINTNTVINQIEDNLENNIKLNDNYKDEIENLLSPINSLINTIKNIDIKSLSIEDINSYIEQLNNYKNNLIEYLTLSNNISEELKNNINTILNITDDILNNLDNVSKYLQNNKSIIDLTADSFLNLFDDFSNKISNSSILSKFINIEQINNIKEQLSSSLNNIFQKSFVNGKISFENIKNAGIEAFSSMSKIINTIFKNIIFNPFLLFFVGISLLVKKFIDIENAAQNFRREIGISTKHSVKLTEQFKYIQADLSRYGVALELIYKTTEELSKIYGNINNINREIVSDLSKFSEITGTSIENTGELYKIFLNMLNGSDKTAKNMVIMTSYASNLAGIPLVEIFDEIKQNSEFIAKYIGKSTTELLKTVINSKKLGLNLKEVSSITEKIMDFEQSIQDELMASVLLGKEINFNRARQLIIDGKINEAMKEVTSQIGTYQDFIKLNIYAKQQLANTLGLTVENLNEMYRKQEMYNNLSEENKKKYEEALDIIEGRVNLTEEEMLLNLQNKATLVKIGDLLSGIGTKLGTIFYPLFNVLNGILYGIEYILNLINNMFEYIGINIKDTKNDIEGFLKSLTSLLITISPLLMFKFFKRKKILTEAVDVIENKNIIKETVSNNVSNSFGTFSKIDPKRIIAVSSSILILSSALYVFAKALEVISEIKNVWESLAVITVGLIALSAAAAIMAKLSPVAVLSSLAILALSGALYVFGNALNVITPFINTFFNSISLVINSIGNLISSIGTAFLDIANSLLLISNLNATNILLVAAAISALGASFLSFGAGSFLGNIIGNDPLSKLKELVSLGPGLAETGKALEKIKSIFDGKSTNIKAESVETEKIDINYKNEQYQNNIILKLEEIINLLKNSKQDIYLDGRKVNTNLSRVIIPSKIT